jgi:predicted acylesterase/phospholipase RssA
MERRSFVAGLTTSGVIGLLPAPRDAAASALDQVPAASTAASRVARKVAAKELEENAIAREILAKTLGPRFGELSSGRYQLLHRSLEGAIKRSLPPGQDYARFNAQAVARLASDDPLRRELGKMTDDAFVQRMLRASGVRDSVPPAGPPPATCLVLSGGGTKGSFEVGFLVYLKKLWNGLNITAVCGTSVGSVNAVPISQSGSAGIDRLVDLWLALTVDGDMYTVHPSLLPAQVALSGLGIQVKDLTDLFDADGLQKLADALGIDLVDEAVTGATGVGALVSGAAVGGPWGLFFALAGIVGFSAAGSQAVSSLNGLKARFQLLGKALSTLFDAPGLNSFLPLLALIRRNVDVAQLGRPDKPKLRLAMVCLEDGDLYYFCETGALLRGSANPSKADDAFWQGALTLDKVGQAVIASSSVPVLFPAVPLTEDHGPTALRRTRHFVDGGIREVLPARAAVDLGCERMIGVLASPLKMGEETYAQSPPAAFGSAFRVLGTVINEVALSDTEYVRDPALRVLSFPMTEVVDSFTVDPGLIRINLDYGYMRGYDATLGLAGKQLGIWELSALWLAEEEIVRLRKEIWSLEHAACVLLPRGAPRPGSPPSVVPVFNRGVLASIRAKKRELMEATLMRFQASRKDRDSLPITINGSAGPATSIHDWWRTWEHHQPGPNLDPLATNGLWSRLRIGLTGPSNTQDVLEAPGSVPAAPSTSEF